MRGRRRVVAQREDLDGFTYVGRAVRDDVLRRSRFPIEHRELGALLRIRRDADAARRQDKRHRAAARSMAARYASAARSPPSGSRKRVTGAVCGRSVAQDAPLNRIHVTGAPSASTKGWTSQVGRPVAKMRRTALLARRSAAAVAGASLWSASSVVPSRSRATTAGCVRAGERPF